MTNSKWISVVANRDEFKFTSASTTNRDTLVSGLLGRRLVFFGWMTVIEDFNSDFLESEQFDKLVQELCSFNAKQGKVSCENRVWENCRIIMICEVKRSTVHRIKMFLVRCQIVHE